MMNDLVSKQEARRKIHDTLIFDENGVQITGETEKTIRRTYEKVIQNLITVEPKKGKWILLYERLEDGSHADHPDGIYCTYCSWINICGRRNIDVNLKRYKYCPNCGASMRREA